MRVTFPRVADYQRGYAVVERDDGGVYQLTGSGVAGSALPHDLRHFVVERELGIGDGIWGSIAAGAVYSNMRHLSGRRPPHAADGSMELKREYRNRMMAAGLLANLAESVAALDDPTAEDIAALSKAKLGARALILPPPEAIAAAARALQVEAARWARLRPGQELSFEWPSWQVPRLMPRQRYPGDGARRRRTGPARG